MTTPSELRGNVAALFKARPPIADPRVVDVLIYKGREELESIVLQHKQRHHLVGEYVLGPRAMRKAKGVAAAGEAMRNTDVTHVGGRAMLPSFPGSR